MPAAVENRYVVAQLDELEPAPRIAPGGPTTGDNVSISVAASTSPRSVSRRFAHRAASM